MTEPAKNEENNEISKATSEKESENGMAQSKPSAAGRILFLGLTAVCFAYLYYRLNGAAVREGLSLIAYMTQVFANVA